MLYDKSKISWLEVDDWFDDDLMRCMLDESIVFFWKFACSSTGSKDGGENKYAHDKKIYEIVSFLKCRKLKLCSITKIASLHL